MIKMTLVQSETSIKRNTLIKTFDEITKEYKISFDVKPSSFQMVWGNVIHFTVGVNVRSNGSRIPFVCYERSAETSSALLVSSQINGAYHYQTITDSKYTVGEWAHVEISQIQDSLGYNYTVRVDGQEIYTTINRFPETFYNVKCYISDPWYPTQSGFIKNVFVYLKPEMN